MRRHFLPLLLCAAALPVAAQMMAPVGVDLFGDEIARPLKSSGGGPFIIVESDVGKPAIPGYSHTLLFQDGRQLRGALKELTKDEIVWSRPDAEPLLRFSRNEARRILFSADVPTVTDDAPRREKVRLVGKDVSATVKLAGGDWLFGDIRSENGDEFSVTIAPGASLKFPRAAVGWLYFGKQPAPAFGFSGEPLGMEGWIFGNPSTPVEVADGWFKLQGPGWIGRDISPPERFEIDFEVPDTKEVTRLWLQPYRPSPNSYSTGTIELSFEQKEMTRMIFINRFEREKTALPQDKNPSGRVRYRVFYDLPGQRLAVMRNETLVGEWKLRDEANPAAAGDHNAPRLPKGICFDRANNSGPLVLGRFRIQPWDGSLPQAGRPPEARMVDGGVVKPGKLEGITDSEIAFAGGKSERAEGTFIDFAQAPAGMAAGDALVTFGSRGELAAAGLEIREGRVRGRTAAIADLDLPVELIHGIVFPKRKVEVAPNADVLVFRNGDTLGGHLVAAKKGAPVRWRALNGQELQFKEELVAGARIGSSVPTEASAGSTVELLTGDRIRGELLSLAAELRLRHKTLGERSLARTLLRTVYPSPSAVVLDAGSDPEAWMGLAARGKMDLRNLMQRREANYGRVFLDGVFLNPPAQGSSWSSTGISRVLDKPERYELRCEVADAGGAEPYVSGSLAGNNGTPSLQLNLGHGQLRVYSYNIGGGRGRMFQQEREVSLADKLPEPRSRRELRMFVDTKIGTVDFMVDGVHLMRFGQQTKERAPGLGTQVSLSSYSMSGNVSVLSNVWIGPWNGDVPRAGEGGRGACLNNGDIAAGAIGNLEDGKITIGEGSEGIAIPLERITSIEFGVTPSPDRPAARLRLIDGTVLNLRDFTWEDAKFRGETLALGMLEVAAGTVSELIFSPAPVRFPRLSEPKKLANKGGEPVPVAGP
jgi:hypothetical protein